MALQKWNYTIMAQTQMLITKVRKSFLLEMILKKKYLVQLHINIHKKAKRFNNLKYLIK